MSHVIESDMTATVWKVMVEPGAIVHVGTELFVLESMKMEIPVESDSGGVVAEILVKEGEPVKEGQPLASIQLA